MAARNGNGNRKKALALKKPPTRAVPKAAVLEFPKNEGPFLLAYGTLTEGIMFTGPFYTEDAALDFAEMYLSAYNWEVAQLQNPEQVKP